MKKITFYVFLLTGCLAFSQKSTGVVTLNDDMEATLSLNQTNSLVTLTLVGPNDRWFALQFGSFTGGMQPGTDVVYWNGSILVDAKHNGIGVAPTTDPVNNWTQVSNTNNSPSAGLRTLVYTRPFNSGDTDDYLFNYSDVTIDLAYAVIETATFTLQYHGGPPNRGVYLNVPLTDLSVTDFSLNATEVYPNPSNGNFSIKTKTNLDVITIYSQTGALIRTISVNDPSENIEVTVNGLQSGIYFIELKNKTDKSWKKIIVN
ncbi:T9SS type A sorting domain-containing protein [Flavobacterium orientale]|uniref:T9SS C-terminal target domain-containing protein n=1 Tax=Flavobacterium orientale TaxID=1756020 RepID=A0A917DDG9_9FLAO|nr:T9SS type A sorting domain-containing protein [Flavobacterium orientale]GGD29323.1 T9SS C-terminal target domain-containing protein [Flavobacterium orientale]